MTRRQPNERLAVAVLCSILIAGLAWSAYRSDGFRASELKLHDGSVWATDGKRLGRYNAALQMVDTKTAALGASIIDLLQVDDRVFVTTDSQQLLTLDVAEAVTRTETTIPQAARVAVGGTNGALLDPGSGRFWFTDSSALGSIVAAPIDSNTAVTEGFVELDGASDVVVGHDGRGHVLARSSGRLWRFDEAFDLQSRRPASGSTTVPGPGVATPSTTAVDVPIAAQLAETFEDVELTAAGPTAVILDRSRRQLVLEDGRKIAVPESVGGNLRLQLPSADPARVLLAGDRSLVSISLADGSLSSVATSGAGAIRPLRLRGCAYGAWATGWVRLCDGQPVEGGPAPDSWPAPVSFRVNRGEVVLNYPDGKLLAFADSGTVKVENWNQALDPNAKRESDDKETDKPEESDEPNPCIRKEGQNAPPIGVPDSFQVRVNRTVRLDVLSGVGSAGQPDTDPDCDVLAIRSIAGLPVGAGKVDIIASGRAVQFTAPSTTRTLTFSYLLTDGVAADPVAVAVTVTVVGEDANREPIANADRTSVESGRTVIVDVLANDTDPELDPIVVASASIDSPAGDAMVWQPNGRLSYTAPGGVTGARTVTYQIIDAKGASATAQLEVSVLPPEGNQPPKTVDDVVQGLAGSRVSVNLLGNDSDPNNDPLQLVAVEPYGSNPIEIGPVNKDAGGSVAFEVPTDKPGAYSFVYRVSDGSAEATGRLRVEFLPAGDEHAPVAVADRAVVTGQKPTMVDVLANDVDLNDDVLMVTSVILEEDAARDLSVAVIDNALLRISARSSAFSRPTHTVRYVVTDGYSEVTGSIEVTFSSAAGGNAPIVLPDEARVHAGGALSLPVLRNDFDPDADPLTLLKATIDPEIYNQGSPGILFVQGDLIRYLPPRESQRTGAFTVTGTYTVTDGSPGVEGRTAQGRFRIEVTPSRDNLPPRPFELELRLFAGGTGIVRLPAFGIDPDGDVVTIDGIEKDPARGSLGPASGTLIEYTAAPGYVGRDRFELRVLDEPSFGADEPTPGYVVVKVVVAPRRRDNPPVAVPDVAFIKPNTTANIVPVLANDQDAEGDQIVFAEPAFDPPAQLPAAVRVSDDGSVLVIDSPAAPGSFSFSYYITDRKHDRVRGLVTVVVDEEAPNLPPRAKDDEWAAVMANAAPVDIDVLANDTDPENEPLNIDIGEEARSLGVTVVRPEPGGSERPVLRVPIGETSIRFSYAVTDGTNTSYAVVTVPVLQNRAPVARVETVTLQPDQTTMEIDVAGLLSDPDGDPVAIWTQAKPTAARAEVFSDLTWSGGGSPKLQLAKSGSFTEGAQVLVTYRFHDVRNGAPGKFGTGSIFVNVLPVRNSPPRVESAPVTLEAGGSVSVNLRPLAYDPDPRDTLSFALPAAPLPRGVTAAIADGIVTLSAAVDAVATGTVEFRVPYSASDGKADGTSTAELRVAVRPSSKPGPQAIDDQMPTIDQGGAPGRVDVVRNDVPSERNVVKVIRVGLSPDGTASIVDDRTVQFSPRSGFSGTTSFVYVIDDGREDPRYQSSATVVVSVRDRPGTPGRPTTAETASARAVVSFTSPGDNGAPIDRYEVRVNPGGRIVSCPASPCVVSELTNGTEYQFDVRAHNAVGWSEWSASSAPYRPDEVPGRAPRPQVDWNDRQITVTWGAVPNNGSAILDVRAVVTPAPPSGQPSPFSGGQSGGTITVPNLVNGTAYTVTLVARNRQGDGPASDTSAAVMPVGAPILGALRPTIAEGNGAVTVSWTPPNGNGDNNLTYDVELTDTQSNARTTTAVGTALSTTIPATNGRSYVAVLVVHNRYTQQRAGGVGVRSQASVPVTPFGVPLQVTGLSASAPAADGNVRLSFTAPSAEGRAITSYQYRVNSGAWTTSPAGVATTFNVGGLALGPSYIFSVRAVNLRGPGDPSASSNPASPYRQPAAPTVSCSHTGGNNIQCAWSINALNGPGPAQVTVSGSTSQTTSPWNSGNVGYNQTRSVTVQVCNGGGVNNCNSASASAGTPSPPNPQLSTSRGTSAGPCQIGSSTCYWVNISVSGMEPGWHNYRCFLGENLGGSLGVRSGHIFVDANGNGTANTFDGRVCNAANRSEAGIQVNDRLVWVNDTGPGW